MFVYTYQRKYIPICVYTSVLLCSNLYIKIINYMLFIKAFIKCVYNLVKLITYLFFSYINYLNIIICRQSKTPNLKMDA